MVNYLPLALSGRAEDWAENLPERLVGSWSSLSTQFASAFRDHSEQLCDQSRLYHLVQWPGEKLRGYIHRFKSTASRVPSSTDTMAVLSFSVNVRHQKVREKLCIKSVNTLKEWWVIVDDVVCCMAVPHGVA